MTEDDAPVVDLAALLRPPVVEEVVDLLRHMLAEAEAGRITAAAVVTVGTDQSFGTGYGGDHQVVLLGGLAHLAHRINRDLDWMDQC